MIQLRGHDGIVHAGSLPLELPASALPDAAARDAHLAGERHLLHVAATRARDELLVTGYGAPSPLLAGGRGTA